MMMPANFSAVNAEVVYGGAVADYLPSAWTAESVKRFNSNIITLVSNSFTGHLLKATPVSYTHLTLPTNSRV